MNDITKKGQQEKENLQQEQLAKNNLPTEKPKQRKTLALRILAGVMAFLLIFTILSLANAFVGNPVSVAMANKEAQRYIDNWYSFLNVQLDKAVYNFKFSEYIVKARSRDNVDVHFNLYYKNGEIVRDDYASYVLSGFNTLERLGQEYSAQVTPVLQKYASFPINEVRIEYDRELLDKASNPFTPGTPFDKNLPIETQLVVYTDIEERTVENITKILTEVHKILEEKEYPISQFGIFAENDGGLVMVHYVTAEDIESGELKERLQAALDNLEQHTISVVIHEAQK